MFDLRKIPVLRALIPYFGGVTTGILMLPAVHISAVLIIFPVLWVLALFLYFRHGRKPGTGTGLFSILIFLLFFMTGSGTGILSRPANPGLPEGIPVLIRGKVRESPHQVRYNILFDLELHQLSSSDTILSTRTVVKVYLPVPADSIWPVQGEEWQFFGKLAPVSTSGNPGSTDFITLMNRKDCWYNFYVSTGTAFLHSNRKIPARRSSFSPELLRQKVTDHWHGGEEEVGLLNAVCLGDRSSLTSDMRRDYRVAGGMHLLAVSGLHVGLIWWVLQYMTGWMKKIFRSEKQRIIVEIGLLWFYAFLTGFSSSVCRSVTMFTFFSINRMMGQRIHTVNGILVSSFLLVVIDPIKLLDIGFQLSYTAIFGIVTLYPVIQKAIPLKNRLLGRLRDATSVSVAAQFSTAPLVIFYFHQLPLYATVTSLLAVPLLSILIAVFVCSVPFISLGFRGEFFNFILIKLALLINCSMGHLSSMPGALLDGLQVDRITLVIWLLVLLMIMVALNIRNRMPWYLVLFLTSASLVWNSLSALNRRSSSELLITHFSNASMVIVRESEKVDYYQFCCDSAVLDRMKGYIDVAWSGRIYKNHQIEIRDTGEARGQVSSCIRLTDGLWLVGLNQHAGLVVTDKVDENVWEAFFGDPEGTHIIMPGFILLAGDPEVEGLLNRRWIGDTDLVADGSCSKGYLTGIKAGYPGIYLTDRSGAYVKRW